MSDFYSGRRTLFADIGGLLGLGLGAIAAALTVWKVLATGFRTGEMEKAFATFLAAVIGAAALGGVGGLGVGRWVGRRWEQTHRRRRPMAAADEPRPAAAPTPGAATLSTFATRPLGAEASRALALVQPSVAGAIPWGAWDGPRLVAVAWVSGAGAGVQVAHAVTDAGYDLDRMVQEIRVAASTPTN
ncbi:MAG: hypothetical protein JNJ98_05190 [Gemmatimonadetes bacterium]|nr:hypothetical protein [Gemmatimonadota bacterium]